ncbi:MAG: hypothetical protein R2729_28480 [Bryobacteraceae bacterium]
MNAALIFAFAIFPADVASVQSGPVKVAAAAGSIRVEWQGDQNRAWNAEFSLDDRQPLITAISADGKPVVRGARPQYWIETGKRRGGFDQFFDFPPSHPDGTRRFMLDFKPVRAVARSRGERVEVEFEGARAGIFLGSIVYRFYPGSSLIQQEAALATNEPDTAYYYDAGFTWTAANDLGPGSTMSTQIAWYDTSGEIQRETLNFFASERQSRRVRFRTIAARTEGGSVAVFPAPHQYMMPRDFTSNLGFVWARSFRGAAALGIRQQADENWIYYPWMNAPPGTVQRMQMFLQFSVDEPEPLLDAVARYTHRDRFPVLPGYKTLAPHWHFAYSVQAMEQGADWTPPFKPVLKAMGVDAAMIADFHGDGHPRDPGQTRLDEIDAYYRFAKSQSDGRFLIIPAEEANVHFGGHWVVSFPKPVRWIMSRGEGQPFEQGGVYRVGNAEEMIRLIREQGGFAYTAHPRTKGSMGFPDKYKDAAFFQDPAFLGAGWKPMPSDLSTLRQGLRALNLLDDMSNWGARKRLLGEVDMFQLDSTHELYGHVNVNYVKMDRLPAWDDYGRFAAAVKRGDYFVSQGTILLPEVKIDRGVRVTARASYTFPLAEAVLVWGDGKATHRDVIPLEKTRAFGGGEFEFRKDAPTAKWARVEFWDIAGNGAFTNPVWFGN